MQEINEATRVMPATGDPPVDRTMVAGAPPVAGATQMGMTVVCAVCKTANSGLETYCGECGFLLASTPGQAEVVPEAESSTPELVESATGRRFRLKPGANVVGRENCDILLMDGTVSRRHATIAVENGAITLTDLGSTNGTQVDSNRLNPNQPAVLAPGAVLRFGNATLTLAAAGSAAEATIVASPAEATLVVQVGESPEADQEQTVAGAEPTPIPQTISAPPPAADAGDTPIARLKPTNEAAQEILVRNGTTAIGRRSSNEVILANDPYVSGRHADLLCDATGCYLTDLGSTNGTLVNGQRLEPDQKQLLLDGDEIGLGQGTYLFETLELPEDESVAPIEEAVESVEQPSDVKGEMA